MRFRVSARAQRDLDEIFVYWAKVAGIEVADRLAETLEDHFTLLADFPNIGRKCAEIAPGVFSFPVGKYLVYYRKVRGVIEILHVFHGARDQRSAFRHE